MQCCKLLSCALGFPDVGGPRCAMQMVLSLLCSFLLYRRLKLEEKEIPEKGLQSWRANLVLYVEPIHKLTNLKDYFSSQEYNYRPTVSILCHSQILCMPFGHPLGRLQESILFPFLQIFVFTSQYCKLKPEGKSQWTFGRIKKELAMTVTGLDFCSFLLKCLLVLSKVVYNLCHNFGRCSNWMNKANETRFIQNAFRKSIYNVWARVI